MDKKRANDGYSHLSIAQLRSELERCEYCATKPCRDACPAHCSPADFIMATRCENPSDFGRAAIDIMKQNPLGHVCGIVCPDTLCMDACTRKSFDGAINIPNIQAAIIQKAREVKVLDTPKKPTLNGKKIAVVGAGPAGLAASAYLASLGYTIDLFDEANHAGGACWMIPEERLPKSVLRDDIDFVMSCGEIHARFGHRVKDPRALLKSGYDAVLLAVGQPDMASLGIIGESLAISSIQYLKNPKAFRAVGQKVAVIGGGAVAADCAVTASQFGAIAVELFVRRRLGEMPITAFEREMLLKHGVDISTRSRIVAINARGGGSTRQLALTVVKTELHHGSLADVRDSKIKRSGFGLVIIATDSKWAGKKVQKRGLFYAGDCVEGGTTVVEAIASGKNVAGEIDQFLNPASKGKRALLKYASQPGSRGKVKSRLEISGFKALPVDLRTDFFGIPIANPFLLSAAPATDGLEQMKKAYEMGWSGGVMKTAFDNVPIHVPGGYMFTFGKKTHGNCDNVSDHPLSRVCREIEELRKLFPDRLTMGSTGGPVTGDDHSDSRVWQSNTKKLENAGAMAVEYSLSCPQGGDGTNGDIVSQNAALTAKVIAWVLETGRPDVPKLFKLTAAVTAIGPIVAAISDVFKKYKNKKAGVTLANSFPVMTFVPARTKVRRWDDGVVVGMSGEGVLPISYLTLAQAGRLNIAISGNGGVMDYQGAANFLALGARTVQVCTIVTKYGLGIIDELQSGLSHFMSARGISSVEKLIGIALPDPVLEFNALSAVKQIPEVRPMFCTSCGNCTRCPYLAISLDKKRLPIVDPSRCVGCTICVKSCFTDALFMRER